MTFFGLINYSCLKRRRVNIVLMALGLKYAVLQTEAQWYRQRCSSAQSEKVDTSGLTIIVWLRSEINHFDQSALTASIGPFPILINYVLLRFGNVDCIEPPLLPMPDWFLLYPSKDVIALRDVQTFRLQDALSSIQHTGKGGRKGAVVMPEDMVDVLLRYWR